MADKAPFGVANPGNVSFIAGVGTQLAFEDLTPDELNIFDRDLLAIADYFAIARDLKTIFLEDRDTYLWAAAIAKKALGVAFGGVIPGSGQFGMGLIRAKTLIVGATDWLQSYSTAGFQNVFGTTSSSLDFSSTSGLAPQNRLLAVITNLYCTTIPKIREVWFHMGATDYGIWPIEFRSIADLYVAGLPASPLISKNGKFYMRGNVGSAIGCVDGTAALGLSYFLAEYNVSAGQE